MAAGSPIRPAAAFRRSRAPQTALFRQGLPDSHIAIRLACGAPAGRATPRSAPFVTPAPEPGSSLGSRGNPGSGSGAGPGGSICSPPAAAASGSVDGPRIKSGVTEEPVLSLSKEPALSLSKEPALSLPKGARSLLSLIPSSGASRVSRGTSIRGPSFDTRPLARSLLRMRGGAGSRSLLRMRGYRMHTSRVDMHPMRPTTGLRGPLPPFACPRESGGRPREGGDPALTPDATAAGGEQIEPPGPAPDRACLANRRGIRGCRKNQGWAPARGPGRRWG